MMNLVIFLKTLSDYNVSTLSLQLASGGALEHSATGNKNQRYNWMLLTFGNCSSLAVISRGWVTQSCIDLAYPGPL